ncbi:Maf family protein [Desulfovibrio sp. Huiquan2017]|uniref:Maf family protein n=1 Tax=Desulfovibrio sp. Huiquan2017 TaxID=2816861 RepID=UPI00256FE00F|nr:Maf family protein [Desulfovibrio sp. Huiquan2017]
MGNISGMIKNGPFRNRSPIVLASGSPRRRELLSDLGLTFDVHPSRLEEPAPEAGETPAAYVLRMAELKTLDVATRFRGATILGADTAVVLGERIMGKPQSKLDALDMLTTLSGATHQVVTGFCVVLPDGKILSESVSTDVDMRLSTEGELMSYIETGEPMDKAGAYAIQGIGTFLVTAIRGSYTNVVGLPLARVLEMLLDRGVVVPEG